MVSTSSPDLWWLIVCFCVAIVGAAVYGYLNRNRRRAQLVDPPQHQVPDPSMEAVQMASVAIVLLDYVTYRWQPLSTQEEASTSPTEDSCAICLGQFEGGDLCSVMPLCRHEFHRDCIANWLMAYNNTCPLCRAELQWLDVAHDMV
ncbi:hypothetical protein QOZ80_9AG0672420 [Eleusine coracana subsp. coracana]|nr:hypothetical protein QOZ80_9AG0672420 [Eleusine coracana subsp. coracana]